MLVDKRLGLGVVQVDGEPIVVVTSSRVAGVAKLPVHIRHLQLERHGLPSAHNLDTVKGVGRQPAVLLMHDGLAVAGRGVVDDPLLSPLGGLAPPVRVRVEGCVVNVGQSGLGIKVATLGTVVSPVFRHAVEVTLATSGDKVVGIDGLDVCADFIIPLEKKISITVGAAGKVASSISTTSGLVGNLPSEDGGRVLEMPNDNGDVVLEGILDGGKTVELLQIPQLDDESKMNG